jgi:hypothetical protein
MNLSMLFNPKRTRLAIHRPPVDEPLALHWLIDGHPATVLIWTPEEWARLDDPPLDAQPCPNGFWCALRID